LRVARKSVFHVARLAIIAVACALLAGCFFTPGRFQSELDIRRDGRFTYSYVGEIVFLMPEEQAGPAWNDGMAECFGGENSEPRPCTEPEIASKRQSYEMKEKRDQEAAEDFSQLFGYNPVDVKANERLAAELMEYPGWKRATYVGNATFQVEYEVSGTLDRDFAFPVIPQVQLAMPFVNVARSKSGVVDMSAAGLASQQLRRLMVGKTPKADQDDPYYVSLQSKLFRSNGTFTLTTDAEITSTNGMHSRSEGLQRAVWNIDAKTSDAPQIQLRLDPQP
jgi:hypothetical protein